MACGLWHLESPEPFHTGNVQQCDSVITLASGKAFSTTFSFLKKMPRALLKKSCREWQTVQLCFSCANRFGHL